MRVDLIAEGAAYHLAHPRNADQMHFTFLDQGVFHAPNPVFFDGLDPVSKERTWSRNMPSVASKCGRTFSVWDLRPSYATVNCGACAAARPRPL